MDVSQLSVVGVIRDPDNTAPCVFCKSPEIDEVNLGPIYTCEDVVCHYYCLLFSAALSQTGSDDQGILGFMPAEIWKEVRRASRLKCTICRKSGASIGCCKTNCHRTFHFPCGLRSGSNFQFIKDYQVFCKKHSALQEVNPDAQFTDWMCPICLSPVSKSEDPIMTTCCKPSVYHKTCLKQMALNAGYFFKCPLCNAGQEFVEAMREQGIFVPEQDASWEREPNAFQDLYEQYQRCDAEVCECSKGREYAASKGGFLLARCRLCGAKGTHRQCGKLKTIAKWACEDCSVAEKNAEKKKKLQVKPKPKCVTKKVPSGRKKLNCSSSDDFVDMSKVRISPACIAYFPYTESQMKRFHRKRKQIIPDWRGLKVQCNLVNWIGNAFEKSAQGDCTKPLKLKIKTVPLQKDAQTVIVKPQQLMKISENHAINLSKPQELMNNSESSKLQNLEVSKSSKPRRRFKVSKWQRGVVNRRRQINASKSVLTSETSPSPISDEPIPSTSRQAAEESKLLINVKQEKAVSPPSSFFKVPNPLKKSPGSANRVVNSGSDLVVEYITEVSSATDNESTCMDVDWTALHPLQYYYENEFLLMDTSVFQEFRSYVEQNVVLTDVAVENISEEFNQTHQIEIQAHSDLPDTNLLDNNNGCQHSEKSLIEEAPTNKEEPYETEKIYEIIKALLCSEGRSKIGNEVQDEEEIQDTTFEIDDSFNNSCQDDHTYSIRLDEFPIFVNLADQSTSLDASTIKVDPDAAEMEDNQQKLIRNGSEVVIKKEKLDSDEEMDEKSHSEDEARMESETTTSSFQNALPVSRVRLEPFIGKKIKQEIDN